jgi:hypothetical protein
MGIVTTIANKNKPEKEKIRKIKNGRQDLNPCPADWFDQNGPVTTKSRNFPRSLARYRFALHCGSGSPFLKKTGFVVSPFRNVWQWVC